MSNTPRTDAEAHPEMDTFGQTVPADFARELEREIEELKKELKPRNGHTFESLQKMWEEAHIELATTIGERDQLKQQLEDEKNRIGHGVLEAKWLDPKCHDGCQSLVLKQQLESQKQELITRGMEIAAEKERCEHLTQQLLAAQLREGKLKDCLIGARKQLLERNGLDRDSDTRAAVAINQALSTPTDDSLIRAIQLDAYKAGMTKAAEICTNEEEMQPITESERNTGLACKTAILTARDNKTSL